MQVAIKPAKPLAFGTLAGVLAETKVPVFGLPGNPVSAMVSFELFARPGLRRCRPDTAGSIARWSSAGPPMISGGGRTGRCTFDR